MTFWIFASFPLAITAGTSQDGRASLDGVTEAESLNAIENTAVAEIRRVPADSIERLVHNGWWKAAASLVVKSHSAKVDLTAPVRRAVADVKREADLLLRWLEPRFANPEATLMATKWAQNSTVVLIAARFSHRWDSPGANLAVYSTKRGRGHVDHEKTAEKIKDMLMVEIAHGRVLAEIVAESGSSRKRFFFDIDLFDEILPERSYWNLEFRKAQGSMQMSSGAQITELVLHLRKRWPGLRRWPRVSVSDGQGSNPDWWADAPITEQDMAALRTADPLSASPLTCAASKSVHCSTLGVCVQACGDPECSAAPTLHSSGRHCVGVPPSANCGERTATFTDADLEHGSIGGNVKWLEGDEEGMIADRFFLRWGFESSPTSDLELDFFRDIQASSMDNWPQRFVQVPVGTQPPQDASHIEVYAANEAGNSLIACARLEDGVRPSPPAGVSFQDVDRRRGVIGGTLTIEIASDETHVLEYELRFAKPGHDSSQASFDEPPLATVKAGGSGPTVRIDLPTDGVNVSSKIDQILVMSVGPGGTRSVPVSINFVDVAPPTVAAANLQATADSDPRPRFATFEVSATPGTCDRSPSRSGSRPCDVGQEYVVFWARDGRRIGNELITIPVGQHKTSSAVESVEFPREATGLLALTRNEYGEMSTGAWVSIKDNRSQSVASWGRIGVLGLCSAGGRLAFWKPFGFHIGDLTPTSALGGPQPPGGTIVSVALGDDGKHATVGTEDGVTSLVDISGSNLVVLQNVRVHQSVNALAFDARSFRTLIGSHTGSLELWNLENSTRILDLRGHTSTIESVEADWVNNRAVSASADGTVRTWDLASGACTSQVAANDGPVNKVLADWSSGHILTAASDETLALIRYSDGAKLNVMEGHSEPVRHLSANFVQSLALSASSDGVVKLWNISSGDVVRTIVSLGTGSVAIQSIIVHWGSMEALAVLADGRIVYWDLAEGGGSLAEPTPVPSPCGSLKASSFGSFVI